MPTIKVFSSPPGELPEEPYVAAAVMSTTLAKASEPLKEPQSQTKRGRAERTRPRNPNRLTVDQHVFPSRSISRFVGEDGRVSVNDIRRGKVIRVKPDNVLFCARRAWDQRTEAG